jgi:hypothetical protein
MEKSTVYPKGIITFDRNPKAPSFKLGTIVIDLKELYEWVKGDGSQYLHDYKGKKQLRLDVVQGKEKINVIVDTFHPVKKEPEPAPQQTFDDTNDLPF